MCVPSYYKRSRHIPPPARAGQPGLRLSRALAAERVPHRNSPVSGEAACQEFRLVEAAFPLFAPIQGHRNNSVEMFAWRNSPFQKYCQGARQRLHPRILEQMNQAAQRAFVHSKAGRMIEASQAGTASRTDTLFIERERVQKGCVADGAEVIRHQRRGRSEALAADWNPSPFFERALANAAIVREKQRKNSVRDPANEIEGSRSRYRTTREGAPPVSEWCVFERCVAERFAAARTQSQVRSTRHALSRRRYCSTWQDVSAISRLSKP